MSSRDSTGKSTGLQGKAKSAQPRTSRDTAVSLKRSQQLVRDLTYQLSVAREQERERIAAGLHDELGQLLAASKITVGVLGQLVRDAASQVSELERLVAKAARSSRTTAFELSPRVLHRRGLEWAIEKSLAENFERRFGLRVQVQKKEETLPLSQKTRSILFNVVQELLFNVQKHAEATTATVSLRRVAREQVALRVKDDGIGFDSESLSRDPAPEGGYGLHSIEDQVGAIGGSVLVDSSPGKGTRVLVRAPMRAPD